MRAARMALSLAGTAFLAVGLWSAVTQLGSGPLLGLALWLAGAVVVHDGILAPLTALADGALDRGGRGLEPGSLSIVRAGSVIGAVLSLVALPALHARSLGTDNPTILTADYAARLAWVWFVIVLAVLAGVTVVQYRSRRRRKS